MRRLRPALVMLSALGGLLAATLLAPSVARADGPGYGGGADRLTVNWQTRKVKNSKILVLYGVGFRSGSGVTVRVGSGADETVQADEQGVLRVPLTDIAIDGKLRPGTSVFAAGLNPAGTRWTLVGNIPPEPSGNGPGDIVPWLVAGAAVVALGGGLLHPKRRRARLAVASGAVSAVPAKAGLAKAGPAKAGLATKAAVARKTAKGAPAGGRSAPGKAEGQGSKREGSKREGSKRQGSKR